MIGEGRVFEASCLLGLTGVVSSSSSISSSGSLLGAGVMLWADPREDAAIPVLRELLIGNDVPLIFGVPLAFGSSDFFLKKPAMDVWFLELEFALVSEGIGVPRVLFEDLEEGTMISRCRTPYRDVCWPRDMFNAGREETSRFWNL